METTEKIVASFEVLKKNIANMAEENDALFVVDRFSDWARKMEVRSARIRKMFTENEEALDFLMGELESVLDQEKAEAIFQGLYSLKGEERHDAAIMIRIMEKLLPFYEEEKNYDRLVFLYINIAYEQMEYFLRMDTEKYKAKVRDNLKKVLALRYHYQEIKELENRQRIFMAYYNLISSLPDLVPEYCKDKLAYYEEAMAFYHSNLVQEIDGDSEEIQNEILYLNDIMMTSYTNYLWDNSTQQEHYAEVLSRLIMNCEEDEDACRIPSVVLAFFKKQITYKEMLDQIEKAYFEMVKDFSFDHMEEDFMAYCSLQDTAFNLIELIAKFELMDEKAKSRIDSILEPIKGYLYHVSFAERTSYYDDILADTCQFMLPYGKDIAEKEDLLMHLLIRRQPITYIHSLMVEQIVALILAAIYMEKAEVREALFGQLTSSKEEEMAFMRRSARLHDVGKCRVAGIINLQGRKLLEEEFAFIKLHPEKALEFVGRDKDFAPYLDIMLGHHKTFDGKGYPASFDNLTSVKKAYIDLISIADSIDSATDRLGRNYAKGKDFSCVLKELVEESGSRYNGALVSFIANNELLCKRLSDLTGQGRMNVYFDAYQKIACY